MAVKWCVSALFVRVRPGEKLWIIFPIPRVTFLRGSCHSSVLTGLLVVFRQEQLLPLC